MDKLFNHFECKLSKLWIRLETYQTKPGFRNADQHKADWTNDLRVDKDLKYTVSYKYIGYVTLPKALLIFLMIPWTFLPFVVDNN